MFNINLNETSTKDVLSVLEDICLICQDSTENGNLPSEIYSGVFALIADALADIRGNNYREQLVEQ